MTDTRHYPANHCPVCGADNRCAMAADPGADDCWCRRVQIPATALAAIPPGAVGKSCLCRECATNKGDQTE